MFAQAFSTVIPTLALFITVATALWTPVGPDAACVRDCLCFPIPASQVQPGQPAWTLFCPAPLTSNGCIVLGTYCSDTPPSPVKRRARRSARLEEVEIGGDDTRATELNIAGRVKALQRRTPKKVKPSAGKATYAFLSKVPGIANMKLPAWLKKIFDGKGKADQK